MGGSEHTLAVLGGKKKGQSQSVTMIKKKKKLRLPAASAPSIGYGERPL